MFPRNLLAPPISYSRRTSSQAAIEHLQTLRGLESAVRRRPLLVLRHPMKAEKNRLEAEPPVPRWDAMSLAFIKRASGKNAKN